MTVASGRSCGIACKSREKCLFLPTSFFFLVRVVVRHRRAPFSVREQILLSVGRGISEEKKRAESVCGGRGDFENL